MKNKIIITGFILVLCLSFQKASFAESSGGAFSGYGRATANLTTFYMEWPRILKYEKEKRGFWAFFTTLPHIASASIARAASTVQDLFITPVYYPLTKDATPLTRHFELADYPWQDPRFETDTF